MASVKKNAYKKTGIVLMFLPLAAFWAYFILAGTKIFDITWSAVSAAGIVWSVFAFIVAIGAIWYSKTGSILAIILGIILFSFSIFFHNYEIFYIPISTIYFVGGVFYLIGAFKKYN